MTFSAKCVVIPAAAASRCVASLDLPLSPLFAMHQRDQVCCCLGLQIMNLQKVIRCLHAFYEERLSLAPSLLPRVDEAKVRPPVQPSSSRAPQPRDLCQVEAGDPKHVALVLELLLGCAVQVRSGDGAAPDAVAASPRHTPGAARARAKSSTSSPSWRLGTSTPRSSWSPSRR